jgi:putative DNA methylase
MTRWCELFMPRQLLGHVTLIEQLRRLTPEIISDLGEALGRAVVTFLQFTIDKAIDYNSNQTHWDSTRSVLKGTFAQHNFSLQWTFGEMIFAGPNSGAAWALDQIIDAYAGVAELVEPVHRQVAAGADLPVKILHGSAAHLADLADSSVDLVCIDPPFYNSVQYGELSNFFYVWQRRSLRDLYPEIYARRLVNRRDEAVANPARDGSAGAANAAYERMMREIFAECRRLVKADGLMTVMFTHISQDAWEALTRSLIESDWTITSTLPLESESSVSIQRMGRAAVASAILLTCRKRPEEAGVSAAWTGIGGTGVESRIRRAVEQGLRDFEPLRLNPVDEIVACYGRALQVLSAHWPVMDGDEPVSPLRAMNEASSVVATNQIARITKGRITVAELDAETRMVLTMFGIFGLAEFAFDEAEPLALSRYWAAQCRRRIRSRYSQYWRQHCRRGPSKARPRRRGGSAWLSGPVGAARLKAPPCPRRRARCRPVDYAANRLGSPSGPHCRIPPRRCAGRARLSRPHGSGSRRPHTRPPRCMGRRACRPRTEARGGAYPLWPTPRRGIGQRGCVASQGRG